MYTVQADTDANSVIFGPPARSRAHGDWPIFTLSPSQADALATQLHQAANTLRWFRAPAFAVGANESGCYHLAAPKNRSLALESTAVCGKEPAPKWCSIRPLGTIDPDDPLLCPVCAARWKEKHP